MDSKINNIMNQNLMLSDGVNAAIDTAKLPMQIGASSLITSGTSAVTNMMAVSTAKAVGATKTAAVLSVAPAAFAVVGTTLLLGGAGYIVFAKIRDDRYIAGEREKYYKNIQSHIWMSYFQDEITKIRTWDEEFAMKRDHEVITSYIKYLEDSISWKIDDKDIQDKMNEINTVIEKYIKPERIQDFHEGIRYYCAYNSIGEFTPKDISWHSTIWYEREKLKTDMQNCFKQKIGDKPKTAKQKSNEFCKIRDLFYRFHTIIEAVGKSEKSETFTKYAVELETLIQATVEPSKREEFNLLFRKYRYLGGRCEFDRENVLNAPFLFKFYGNSSSSLNDANAYVTSNTYDGTVDAHGYPRVKSSTTKSVNRTYNSPMGLIFNEENFVSVAVMSTLMSLGYFAGAMFTVQGAVETAAINGNEVAQDMIFRAAEAAKNCVVGCTRIP